MSERARREGICRQCKNWDKRNPSGCRLLPVRPSRTREMEFRWENDTSCCLLAELGREGYWGTEPSPAQRDKVAVARQGAERLGITWSDAKHYAAALAKWAKAGYPVRSQEEVERIAAICKSNACGLYQDGRCRWCGCRVNNGRFPITNKIKMATEHCGLGFWDKRRETTTTFVYPYFARGA